MNEIPEPIWITTAPGRMELPPTKYAITWDGGTTINVLWDGKHIASPGNIDSAKDHVQWHMKRLLTFGFDP